MLTIYVGYDPREAIAYHTFCESVIQYASKPVRFVPLHEDMLQFDGQQDGTNAFIFSRYLVPHLQDYKGWALFCDGDMVVTEDIYNLFKMRDGSKAVQVIKHNYKTSNPRKYIGTDIEADNVDYPRKNWSSVMLWNCGHPSNRILTRDLVSEAGGAFLHRFQWLKDDEIGGLPKEWNHLVGEYEPRDASLYHYTLGVPSIEFYMRCEGHREWNKHVLGMLNVEGDRPEEIVRRAAWRTNGRYNKLQHASNGGRECSGTDGPDIGYSDVRPVRGEQAVSGA